MKKVGTVGSKVIMGIDPGTNKMGYGVIRCHGKDAEYVTMGYISIPSKMTAYQKLGIIFEKIDDLIARYGPEEVAYEAPFFGKNVQSMLKLGRAQGVAMAAALKHGASVFEYSPRKVKLSITGKGAASKEQVAVLIKSILKIKELPNNLDASDGLAVALCHHFQVSNECAATGHSRSWEDFVSSNPDKVKK